MSEKMASEYLEQRQSGALARLLVLNRLETIGVCGARAGWAEHTASLCAEVVTVTSQHFNAPEISTT